MPPSVKPSHMPLNGINSLFLFGPTILRTCNFLKSHFQLDIVNE